jgi:hypothetical protein
MCRKERDQFPEYEYVKRTNNSLSNDVQSKSTTKKKQRIKGGGTLRCCAVSATVV